MLDLSARCWIAGCVLAEGDWLCLDGYSGRVFAGQPALLSRRPIEWLQRVTGWQRACSASPGQEAAGVAQTACAAAVDGGDSQRWKNRQTIAVIPAKAGSYRPV
ncbi:MAG: hypothetical protein V5B33_14035 [Candidatus Accumulibacter sp. UW20]